MTGRSRLRRTAIDPGSLARVLAARGALGSALDIVEVALELATSLPAEHPSRTELVSLRRQIRGDL